MIRTWDAVLPHGITLACRGAGREGAPRVLLLHGFPEAAFVWDEVMAMLADRAQLVAPNQRGYAGSSAPAAVADYRARHLVADLAALIAQVGAPLDLLVAHDWGGAVAWALAATQPQLIRRLLIVNSPHPATFLRELRHNPAQQAASAYMNFFQRADAAQRLAENDFARLWPVLEGEAGAPWLTPALRDRYRAAWSAGLDGPLNWYRASPLRPPEAASDAVNTLDLPDALVRVRVPTTVLWGEADHALLPGLVEGLEAWVEPLTLVRVPGASHWIVHERPALVAETIARLVTDGR